MVLLYGVGIIQITCLKIEIIGVKRALFQKKTIWVWSRRRLLVVGMGEHSSSRLLRVGPSRVGACGKRVSIELPSFEPVSKVARHRRSTTSPTTSPPSLMQSPLMQSPLRQSPRMHSPLPHSPLMQSPLPQSPLVQSPLPQPTKFCTLANPLLPRIEPSLGLRRIASGASIRRLDSTGSLCSMNSAEVQSYMTNRCAPPAGPPPRIPPMMQSQLPQSARPLPPSQSKSRISEFRLSVRDSTMRAGRLRILQSVVQVLRPHRRARIRPPLQKGERVALSMKGL